MSEKSSGWGTGVDVFGDCGDESTEEGDVKAKSGLNLPARPSSQVGKFNPLLMFNVAI